MRAVRLRGRPRWARARPIACFGPRRSAVACPPSVRRVLEPSPGRGRHALCGSTAPPPAARPPTSAPSSPPRARLRAARAAQVELEGTEKEWPCDLVILAMGFKSPEATIAQQLSLELDGRSNFKAVYGEYATSAEGVFAAGDCRRGQVRARAAWARRGGRDGAGTGEEGASIVRPLSALAARRALTQLPPCAPAPSRPLAPRSRWSSGRSTRGARRLPRCTHTSAASRLRSRWQRLSSASRARRRCACAEPSGVPEARAQPPLCSPPLRLRRRSREDTAERSDAWDGQTWGAPRHHCVHLFGVALTAASSM